MEIVKTLGDVGILVALCIAAFFFSRPQVLERLWPKKEGSKLENNVKEKTSKDWFDEILDVMNKNQQILATNHFAHVEEKLDTLIGLFKETNGRLSSLQECIKRANTTLAEFKEYGIKERVQ